MDLRAGWAGMCTIATLSSNYTKERKTLYSATFAVVMMHKSGNILVAASAKTAS